MEKNYPISVLDPDNRWKKIIDILKTFMLKEHIICLQEVTSERIQEILQPLCEKYSYSIIGDENCILIPPRFIIKDSNSIRIGRDTILNESKYIPNIMYSVLLYDPKTHHQFYVATYHMPCKYKKPNIMEAHLQQLVKILESAEFPTIFTGDMNMFPSQITIGTLLDSIWNHSSIVDTTFAHIYDEFKGCIDNIFFSKNSFIYNGSEIIPPTNIIPDENNPSDHIPVTCSLILK
jgi:exonuclease III